MNNLKEQPFLSVVIPTYNCSKYIIEAIESVFSQTYSNLEIIVIDDGSIDNTKTIIKPYLNRISYFYQDNQGASKARNFGIEKAKGELIAFLDADDFFLLPTKLSEQIAYFEAQSSLGFVHSGWQIVNEFGNKLQERLPWRQVPEFNLASWLLYNPVRPSAMIFKRNWLVKIGGFDEELRQSEDFDLGARLILEGCEGKWLKKVTVGYRKHGTNTTNKVQQQAENLLKGLDKFFSLSNFPPELLPLKDEIYESKYIWLAWSFYQSGDFKKMVEYLQKAMDKSSHSPSQNFHIWIKSFNYISKEEGQDFDRDYLINLPQWQQLVKEILRDSVREHLALIKKVKLTPQIK
ncbi:glycosyltransferase [Geminocystis sp. NIES-3709]|uniref:glycosyltransferase n=1 Tax=Geminocystis sp. NIES-3709 TaxID=1617448 RepID=UPI0005FC5458|nr:glycosyltransferase [Geminocystis sp. NIES-3709]BAQ64667.1 beta-1,3-glucosyltransferase [Geminocystis sp. NIES-3709]